MSASDSATLTAGEVTKQSGSNFSLSFAFLSRDRRDGISAVYAFCRAADDAVDEAADREDGRHRLAFWRDELERCVGTVEAPPETEIGRELAVAIRRFEIDPEHLRAVVDGCAMDLEGAAYADLESLETYCSKVASAVGLSCLGVFGVDESVAGHYADRLGKALQLTNILRDLRTDAVLGRRYAPADLLAEAGVEPAWLDGSGPAEAYADGGPVHRFVERLAAVARERFAEAAAALPDESTVRRRLIAAEIMGAVYAELLVRVEQRKGHLDRPERLRVPRPRKLMLALRTWWRGRRP